MMFSFSELNKLFQHTAARRRLDYVDKQCFSDIVVSTHSRPKAAGLDVYNTIKDNAQFQHTAARRRLESHYS